MPSSRLLCGLLGYTLEMDRQERDEGGRSHREVKTAVAKKTMAVRGMISKIKEMRTLRETKLKAEGYLAPQLAWPGE
jgi:hypothetical protein